MDFLKCLAKFDFVIGVVSLHRLLHPLHGITVKLRGRTMDILQAYEDVVKTKQEMQKLRDNIDGEFHNIFEQACRLPASMDVLPTKSRACEGKSKHRPNSPAVKTNIAISKSVICISFSHSDRNLNMLV